MVWQVAAVGLALMVGGAVGGRNAKKKAAAAVRESASEDLYQAGLLRQKADIVNTRKARDAVREAAILRARVVNATAVDGVQFSSGAKSSIQDVKGDLVANFKQLNELAIADEKILQSQERQVHLGVKKGIMESRAADNQALSDIGSSIFGAGGGFGAFMGG